MTFNKITYSLYQKVKYLIDAAYPNIDENVIENYKKINIVLSKKTLKQNEKYEDRKCIIYNLYRQESELSNSLLICTLWNDLCYGKYIFCKRYFKEK